jgi:hypothetical protein
VKIQHDLDKKSREKKNQQSFKYWLPSLKLTTVYTE